MEGTDAASLAITTPHRHLEGLKTTEEETTRVHVARRHFGREGSAEGSLGESTWEAEILLIYAETCG